MTREEIIERLWADSPLFMPLEEFARSLEGWEFDLERSERGEVAVCFLVKGPEFHFFKLDPAYQCTRETLRRYPGGLIEQYGYALTKTPKDDERQLRFNARLGFYRVGEDEHDVHLRIDRLRVKETTCQQ